MRLFLFFLVSVAVVSCKQNISPEQKILSNALEAYKTNPSDSVAQQVSAAFDTYVNTRGYADPAMPDLLLTMAGFASDRKDHRRAFDYYKTYLVEYPDRPGYADRLFEAIGIAEKLQQPELNDVLYKSFAGRYPQDPRSADMQNKIQSKDLPADSLIRRAGATMFNDSTFRLNEVRARLYIDLCEAGVMANPALSNATAYLNRAAETARTLRDIPKAITLFDWIIRKYPEHTLAATSLFLKGFTYDNDLKDFKKAGEIYNEFLTQYPNNEYAESAKFLLENLGKSEQELIKMLEKNKEEVQ